MRHILKCTACGIYTLKDECGNCGQKTIEPRPPKYSPEDKYSSYRRAAKQKTLMERGLI